MRLAQFQIVLLVGFMFLASSAAAEKAPGGGKEGGREGGRAANNAPRNGGGNNPDRGKDTVHNDAVRHDAGGAKSAARDHVDRANVDRAKTAAPNRHADGAVNNLRQNDLRSGNTRPGADVRVNPRANIAGPQGNNSGPNAWRYRQYNNRWWYWTANNNWVYWNNGAWLPYGAYAGSRYYNRPYVSGYRGTVSVAGPYLGVTFDPRQGNIAIISQVNANSPAEAVGLRPGDVIRAINGAEIRSPYEPTGIIRQYTPGTEVTLNIERNRQVMDVGVVLGQQ